MNADILVQILYFSKTYWIPNQFLQIEEHKSCRSSPSNIQRFVTVLPPSVCVAEEQFINDGNLVEAREAAEEDLLVVHTKRYLNRLKVELLALSHP